MAIRTQLSNKDRDELTKDVDDLDKVYLEQMRDQGIDEELLEQFKDLTLQMKDYD
ncbi:MAG: hypothetical protein SO178_04890 [Floccifex porci]|uniref:hypothetical protein n=1 Tax=Floccifex porci TaxID=2606629 RepID=UPI00198178DE|nr:hypothetical protein [Floccifex porci]MCI7801842.1 hypothetical protein [Erysipelotrichaceae bacterium]MDD7467388.1 hypothetical protein [Floccifex porci]MDO4480870.1 hypothetical protein [Erysipelotrichaceae bacterium]MDY4796985.1 hypothetical protein [Floccifex porci]